MAATNKAVTLQALRTVADTLGQFADNLMVDGATAYEPASYPTFTEASYVAGGNVVTVSKFYPDKEKALLELDAHQFLLFFDADGEKLGEARIIERAGKHFLVET
jgi:hypothetical protein